MSVNVAVYLLKLDKNMEQEVREDWLTETACPVACDGLTN